MGRNLVGRRIVSHGKEIIQLDDGTQLILDMAWEDELEETTIIDLKKGV